MGFFSHVETWSCLYWNKGEFDRPFRIDGWWWTRILIIIIRIGENITWNSMGCYVHNTLWLGMKNVTGFGDSRCFLGSFLGGTGGRLPVLLLLLPIPLVINLMTRIWSSLRTRATRIASESVQATLKSWGQDNLLYESLSSMFTSWYYWRFVCT
jgi:hypothetical protein